jgi:hypothetical protein
MEDGNDINEHNAACILTVDEILKTGLKLVSYKKCWIGRAKKAANVQRFPLVL